MKNYDVIVLGAGAAGHAAAIRAASHGLSVAMIEAGKPARKVLASGNGRCNLGNLDVDVGRYVTECPDRLSTWLRASAMVRDFWRDLGLSVRADAEGRLYPADNRAQSVADTLAVWRTHFGVDMHAATVRSLSAEGGLAVLTDAGTWHAKCVISALGSPAAPQLGGTDTAYRLAEGLGLSLVPMRPALVPLRTTPHPASLKGCRHPAVLTLQADNRTYTEQGEVLFTDYGLSGIAAMQLSARLSASNRLYLDLMPHMSADGVRGALDTRVQSGVYPTVDKLLVGWLDKPLSYAVLKEAGISPLDKPTHTLDAGRLDALAKVLKGWIFAVDGTLDYDGAQVAMGGISLREVDDTLMCRRVAGLYVVGEALDVTGLCGGYNLHWAWLSGLLAADACARRITPSRT